MATTKRTRRLTRPRDLHADPHATNPAAPSLAQREVAALRAALNPHRFQRLWLATDAIPYAWAAGEVVGVLEGFEQVRGQLSAMMFAGAAGRVPVPLAAVVEWRVLDGWDMRTRTTAGEATGGQ